MAEVVQADAPGAVDAAAEALARGELAVIPTDTVYGLAARPDLRGATARIFEAKRRPRDLTLPVLVADVDAAASVGELDVPARKLADAFWPGGLTLVVRRAGRSIGWDLGEEGDTVGVRVPADPVVLELLRRTGPLAATSANRSGEPPALSCDEAVRFLGDAVAVYLCGGSQGGTPSTVVDLTASPARILRPGAIAEAAVLDFLDPATG